MIPRKYSTVDLYQNRQRLGLCPEPGKEAYNAPPKSPIAGFHGNITLQRILLMSEKGIYLPPNSTSKITKIVSVWGSAPDPAKGAYVSSTTFFSGPTMALSRQPPRLFSLVTSCRPQSAFQRSTYDYSIISSFVQFCPKHATYRRMCKCCVTYLLIALLHVAALRWNRGRIQRAYSGVPYTVEPLHQILAKAPSFGLYTISRVFLKKSDLCHAEKNAFFENAPKLLIAGTSLWTPTELSKGRMDPRVGSGHDFAEFWRVESGQHFENISVPGFQQS